MPNIKWRVLNEGTYRQKVEKIIIGHEKDVPRVYLDPVGIPTFGPGKALVVKGMDKDKNIKWVISEGRPIEGVNMLESVRGSKLTDEQYRKLQTAADNLNIYGPGDKAYQAVAGEYYNNPDDKSQSARLDPANNKFGVEMTPEQQKGFRKKVIDATEADFDRATTKSGKIRLDEPVPFSEERAALISIYHQQPKGIDDDMRAAINNGDRTGVIKSIEGSKAAETYVTRRRSEADQFGRPDDPNVIRHESNSQADLDSTLNKAPQAIPEREVLPKTPAPVVEPDAEVELESEKPDGEASLLDYMGLLKEQNIVAKPRVVGMEGQLVLPGQEDPFENAGVAVHPSLTQVFAKDPFEKERREQEQLRGMLHFWRR